MGRSKVVTADVIFVCDSLGGGGTARVISTLANEWSRRGRKIWIITFYHRNFYALDPEVRHAAIFGERLSEVVQSLQRVCGRVRSDLDGLPRRVPRHDFFNFLRETRVTLSLACWAWALRRAVQQVDAPVIVAMSTAVNVVALKASRRLGRRVIVSERTDLSRQRGIWGTLARRVYNGADHVTANTRAALHDLGGFVRPEKLAYLPNPVVLEYTGTNNRAGRNSDRPLSPDGPSPLRTPVILIVARLEPVKRHDVLLDAFALARTELGSWRLAILGEGKLKEKLRARAERLGIARQIDWHGAIKDPRPFYSQASIFALPSRFEGMPNALLEAMSYGLPVVVSDSSPGPLELVEDGVSGLVVPVGHPRALAQALRRLANDETLRHRLGSAARTRISEHELPQAIAAWETVLGMNSAYAKRDER